MLNDEDLLFALIVDTLTPGQSYPASRTIFYGKSEQEVRERAGAASNGRLVRAKNPIVT